MNQVLGPHWNLPIILPRIHFTSEPSITRDSGGLRIPGLSPGNATEAPPPGPGLRGWRMRRVLINFLQGEGAGRGSSNEHGRRPVPRACTPPSPPSTPPSCHRSPRWPKGPRGEKRERAQSFRRPCPCTCHPAEDLALNRCRHGMQWYPCCGGARCQHDFLLARVHLQKTGSKRAASHNFPSTSTATRAHIDKRIFPRHCWVCNSPPLLVCFARHDDGRGQGAEISD
jgi:hypothetical protein